MLNFTFLNSFVNLFNDTFSTVIFFLLPEIYLFFIILIVLCYVLFLKNYAVSKDFVKFNIYFVLPFLLFLLLLLSIQFNYSGIFFNSHFFYK